VIFAAGNANHDINNRSGGSLDGFAIHPDVIAIAASNSRDKRSHYSNFGDEIWVCAPSSGAGGLGIVTTDRRGTQGYQSGDYTTEERFGGTSSATPLVAGLCGLILSVNPDLTAEDVKDVLKVTADKIDPQNGNYDANGHSRLYGWGRVNAFAALQEARRRRNGGPAEHIVRFESRPDLAIPDSNPVGVSDSIQVGDSRTVQSVLVDINITHTYRGDLKVTLTSPDGTSVLLFGRTGPVSDSRDNLIAQFTTENVPGLGQLDGKNASGNWTLQVADLATVDLGILNSWVLTLGLAPVQTEWEVTPGARIPDNNPTGIASDISVNRGGTLRDISVSVDISHTYRGDLKVTLEAPNGMTATLKNVNNRDGADNLRQTYRASDFAALRTLVTTGIDVRGRWRLRVSDNLSLDEGKLNAWSLKLIV
jgi:subtilisin-like proprotein convertase family protein